MKKTIIKFFDKIVILLLVMMGVFSSCTKDEPKPVYGTAYMYGILPDYGIKQSEYEQKQKLEIEKDTKVIEIEEEIE